MSKLTDRGRAVLREIQALIYATYKRQCVDCGRDFLPADLKHNLHVQVCATCASADDPTPTARRDPRAQLRQYGLESWRDNG